MARGMKPMVSKNGTPLCGATTKNGGRCRSGVERQGLVCKDHQWTTGRRTRYRYCLSCGQREPGCTCGLEHYGEMP